MRSMGLNSQSTRIAQILWARHLDNAHGLKVRHDGTKSLHKKELSSIFGSSQRVSTQPM